MPTGQYDYFTLSVAEKLDYTFTVTPITGAVSVFVNPCGTGLPESQCGAYRPSRTYNVWSSAASLSSQVVFISSTDTNACARCVYVVAVYASSASNYTIVASGTSSAGNNSAITLQVRSVVVFLYPCLRGVAWCGVFFSWCTV